MAFEGVVALDGVDLALHRGEILGLIGPNGAGKTTLLNVMSGFVKPMPGRVLVTGVDVTRWEPDARVRQGIARSFQGVRLFNDLTVAENLEVPALALGLSRRATTEYAESLLQRTNLGSRSAARAGSLSAGDQHRVGVLRALALKPAFLLLDEPAAGLNEVESDELVVLIRPFAMSWAVAFWSWTTICRSSCRYVNASRF